MSKHSIDTVWMGGMKFNSLVNGHTITLDAPERAGGQNEGPIPKPLILTALSGCTGMDVIAILRKQNLVPESLEMEVEGDLTTSAPLVYQNIKLVYRVQAPESMHKAIIGSVLRSQNELCGVAAMLRKATSLSWELWLNNKKYESA